MWPGWEVWPVGVCVWEGLGDGKGWVLGLLMEEAEEACAGSEFMARHGEARALNGYAVPRLLVG